MVIGGDGDFMTLKIISMGVAIASLCYLSYKVQKVALGTVFGVGGAGLAGYKMQKRVGAVEDVVVETLKWAWRHLALSKEQYCLRYESSYLLQLGKAMDYFASIALSVAVQTTLMETAFATLVSAVAWPMALVSVASVVDNPWNTCVRRAQENDILLMFLYRTLSAQLSIAGTGSQLYSKTRTTEMTECNIGISEDVHSEN